MKNMHKIVIPFIGIVMLTFHFITQDVIKVDSISIILLVLALSPYFSKLIENLEIGGAKIKFFREEQEEQKKLLKQIRFLIAGFVTDYEVDHLENLLNANQAWIVRKGPATQKFMTELGRLRDLALIGHIPGQGIRTILRELDKKEINMHDYFFITENGKEYLALRKDE